MNGSKLKLKQRSLRWVFVSSLLLALSMVIFGMVVSIRAAASISTTDDDFDSPVTCNSSPSFWEAATSSGCTNKDGESVSLKDFLRSAVFGQDRDSSTSSSSATSEKDNDKSSKHPFLSYIENHRKERPVLSFLQERFNKSKSKSEDEETNNSSENNNRRMEGNPFLAFVDAMHQTRESILDWAKEEQQQKSSSNEKILTRVLEKAHQLAQQDEEANAMTTAEFVSIMKAALKKVAKQLQDNFGDLLSTTLDAYIALAIPYFALAVDSNNSPLTKRRLHRFYQSVTKDEWIDLHDALYLSQLAYVDTIQQFEAGLEKFDDNSWTKLYGTTQSKPDLPASFLLIHKEIDPLEMGPNTKIKKKANQPQLIQDALLNMGVPEPQKSEVLVTLVVRGTKHISDFLQDGMLEPEEYRGGYAHGGILASGKNLAKQYLPKLRDLHEITKRDKIKVILIGHSLGAGAAAIAAMELKEHDDFLEVEAVGFGCPSLLSRDLQESTRDYITTVVNDADIVSRMSGASMTNILLDLMDYDWTQDALEDLGYSLERAKKSFPDFAGFFPDTNKTLQWFENRLNETVRPNLSERKTKHSRQERLPSVLIPPGTCIHLFRDGYGVTGTYTPCDFFSAVEFSLTLLDDHLILTGYNRALLAAAQDSDRDYSFQFKHNINGIVGI